MERIRASNAIASLVTAGLAGPDALDGEAGGFAWYPARDRIVVRARPGERSGSTMRLETGGGAPFRRIDARIVQTLFDALAHRRAAIAGH